MIGPWGRFTACGSRATEALAEAAVTAVRDAAARTLPDGSCVAVVLLGGYGRGEGGVEKTPEGERLHNNLDVLAIGRRKLSPALSAALGSAMAPVRDTYGIGVDTGTTSVSVLRHSECLVMWYDMRNGHKTLLGDPRFVLSLDHFTHDRIVPTDVDALVTNRASLLLLNELLLPRAERERERRTILKHAFKAIIGYGDALLFTGGAYHHSYIEKARRMRTLWAAPESLRALYEQATDFRFRPDYERFADIDLAAWHASLRATLEPVHRLYASRRLGTNSVSWDAFPDALLRRSFLDGGRSPRDLCRRALNMVTGREAPSSLSLSASIGLRSSGVRASFAVALPIVLYDVQNERLRVLAAELLGAEDASREGLLRAYVRAWSSFGDSNGRDALGAMGIHFEEAHAT